LRVYSNTEGNDCQAVIYNHIKPIFITVIFCDIHD